MTVPRAMPPADIHPLAALERLVGAIAEARRRIARGEAAPLEDLAQGLPQLLAAAHAQPGGAVREQLTALLDELEQLAAAVEDEHHAVGTRLRALSHGGRARRAYAGGG